MATRHLSAEVCEARRLLAGNVVAAVSNFDATLTGDNADNKILIEYLGGNVVAQGLDGTTINGSADGFILIQGTDFLDGDLTVWLERGDDVLLLRNFDLLGAVNIQAGAGNDRIGVRDLFANGDLAVSLGTGNDSLHLQDLLVDDTLIDDDAGRNTIVADKVTTETLSVTTGNGRDRISILGCYTADDLSIATGNGNDLVNVGVGTIAEYIDFFVGGGGDTVILSIDTEGLGFLNLVHAEGGNDTVLVSDADFAGLMDLEGGGGVNSLLLAADVNSPNGEATHDFQNRLSSLAEVPGRTTRQFNGMLAAAADLDQFFDSLA